MVLLLCLMVFGCQAESAPDTESGNETSAQAGTDSTSAETSDETPTQAELNGTVLELEKFTITKADGWESMDVDGGVQIYKSLTGDILQIQILGNNVTEEEDKTLLENLAQSNDGTPLEQVTLLGLVFFSTTFESGGVEQTYYSTVNNSEQIKIQVTGKSYESNADIKAMVESILLNER